MHGDKVVVTALEGSEDVPAFGRGAPETLYSFSVIVLLRRAQHAPVGVSTYFQLIQDASLDLPLFPHTWIRACGV